MKVAIMMNDRLWDTYFMEKMPKDNLVETYKDFTFTHKPTWLDIRNMADTLYNQHHCYIEVESVYWEWINQGAHGFARVVYLYNEPNDKRLSQV